MKIHWGVKPFVLILSLVFGAVQSLIAYTQIGDAEYREFLDYREGKSPRQLVAIKLDGWFLLDDAVDVAFFDHVFRHSKCSFEIMADLETNYLGGGFQNRASLIFDDGTIFDDLVVSLSDSHPCIEFSRREPFFGDRDWFGVVVEPEKLPFRVAKYFEIYGCGPK
ncbi:hypothetical protein [Tuwongella immobilis]|uniref:Uncharacterized protein n=1 Tax=Tuwongella immobilis TaxID=692036 RepID=A0A6C2YTL8_9BACT|nr:hypothetical protein [Tuwongella immobilis]VIP05078.1 unnamed protein product [Tuwongella immobilis]VTS07512.1 unnamed protein product [Tuwongella immobilis]